MSSPKLGSLSKPPLTPPKEGKNALHGAKYFTPILLSLYNSPGRFQNTRGLCVALPYRAGVSCITVQVCPALPCRYALHYHAGMSCMGRPEDIKLPGQ